MKLPTITKTLKSSKVILSKLSGEYVDDTRLVMISKEFCKIMGITSQIKQGLVYQSCLHLLDTIPDTITLTETFRKVLANDEYIWGGISIPIWRGEPVNVTVGVIRASETKVGRTITTKIYFRVLTGLPAGMLMSLSAPSWWVHKIVSRKLGLFRSGIQASSADIAGPSFNVRLSTKDEKGNYDLINITELFELF